jgi:hypothetical protein
MMVPQLEYIHKGDGRRVESIHKGVRKSDFGAVDSAVPGSLDYGEDIVVSRVENDALDSGLHHHLVSDTVALLADGSRIPLRLAEHPSSRLGYVTANDFVGQELADTVTVGRRTIMVSGDALES